MSALVTGATGFIGSHLVPNLLEKGYKVRCLVRGTSALAKLDGLDVELFPGDLSDCRSLGRAVRGVDYVFHLAGLTKTAKSHEFYDVNARGTENLVEAAARENPGIRKFVYLSSHAAAGPSLNGLALTEEKEPHPVSHYGKSKLMGERAVLERSGPMPAVVLRPTAVYGPGDRDLYLFFKAIKKGVFPYWGACRYSLLYVEDLVQGIIAAAEAPEDAGKVFFLSDGNIYTNEEIAEAIAGAFSDNRAEKKEKLKILKLPMPRLFLLIAATFSALAGKDSGIINKDKLREMGFPNWCCDPGRAIREIGFVPKITLKEGAKWTADWYRIHQWL